MIKEQSSNGVESNQKYYVLDVYSENELLVYNLDGKLVTAFDLSPYITYPDRLQKIEHEIVIQGIEETELHVIYKNNELTYREVPIVKTPCSGGYTYSSKIQSSNEYTYFYNTMLVSGSSYINGEFSISCELNGKEIGNYIVPLSKFSYVPENYIRVVDDSIYLMIPSNGTLKICKVTLGTNNVSNMKEIEQRALRAEQYSIAVASASSISLTRQEVLDRANRMATYVWTLTKQNIDTDSVASSNLSKVKLPKYIQDIIELEGLNSGGSVQMYGIPYCWGGFMSQYSTTRGKSFSDAIAAGYMAGNIRSTEKDGYIPGTAGIDCSGMVSAAYGLSEKKGTWEFAEFGRQLTDESELQKMDFLVKAGDHMILFYLNLGNGNIVIIESNSTSETGKVIVRQVSLDGYVGYQMRTPW